LLAFVVCIVEKKKVTIIAIVAFFFAFFNGGLEVTKAMIACCARFLLYV